MHELTPPSEQPNDSPWDPNEQVGDIHTVEQTGDRAARVEKLTPVPTVWIGSWLDYNNGQLHGDWIAADQPDEAITADIAAMLARSPTAKMTGQPAEDWGVFDFDNFGPLRIGEQETVEWIGLVGRGIAEHGPAFAAYADVVQDADALVGFEDDYLGQYGSIQDYADNFVEDAGYNHLLDEALPDCIRGYVSLDTAAIAQDMQAGGDVHAVADTQGGVWLFAAR